MKGTTNIDHGDCLSHETLTDYLEGALDPVVTAACEVHLVGCDECRQELALYMRIMNADVSDDERGQVDRLASSWVRRGAAAPVRSAGGGRNRKLFLSIAGLAAAVILGVFFLWTSRGPAQPQTAAEVVQLLLARSRPFEPRMDQQPYVPTVRTRGTDDANVDFGVIAGEMRRLSADSYAMGRFYLLQKDFDHATPLLEEAARQPGASAAVHNDLGVAYMERGGELNARKGAEEFRRALELDGNLAVALFNLALFHERTGALSQAETEWQRYLQLDSNSGWAGEVRSKIESIGR